MHRRLIFVQLIHQTSLPGDVIVDAMNPFIHNKAPPLHHPRRLLLPSLHQHHRYLSYLKLHQLLHANPLEDQQHLKPQLLNSQSLHLYHKLQILLNTKPLNENQQENVLFLHNIKLFLPRLRLMFHPKQLILKDHSRTLIVEFLSKLDKQL